MRTRANRVMNAFEVVAARSAVRAAAAPAAPAVRTVGGRGVPAEVKTLDRLGRRRVPLAPWGQVGFVIEGREQAQASALRRAAMRLRSI